MIACVLTFNQSYTQTGEKDFAPYCTLYYHTVAGPSDIIVGEIRPTISAKYTYFNALSWTRGYTGLQMTDHGPGFIFSLWDPPAGTGSPRALFAAPGGAISRFGGEGTGLHYINTATKWDLNRWYRFVVRCWGSGAETYFALWSQDEQTGVWIHHVTMATPDPHFRFDKNIGSFLEDWNGNGKLKRAAEYRFPWVHSEATGWSAVTTADFVASRRSGDSGKFAKAFNTGGNDGVFFLESGGDSKPSLPDNVRLIMRHPPVPAEGPGAAPDVPPLSISDAHAELKDGTIAVAWSLDETSTPEFLYKIQVVTSADGKTDSFVDQQNVGTETYKASVKLPPAGKLPLYLKLTVTDILDRNVTISIPVSDHNSPSSSQ
jgi:hypothetical protein